MKGTPAIYLGRRINKEHFRTNVYGTKGEKKLVESWAAFEAAMESGIWFATRKDALESFSREDYMEEMAKYKPKRKPRPKPKAVKVEEIEHEDSEIPADELDEMVFEVKNG
jgi:hypothetical protein